jgi:hypothetical protein
MERETQRGTKSATDTLNVSKEAVSTSAVAPQTSNILPTANISMLDGHFGNASSSLSETTGRRQSMGERRR